MVSLIPRHGSPPRRLSVETTTLAAFALTLLGVMATGAAIAAVIASVVTQPSPWMSIVAYAGPAGLALGLYWVLARRL